MYLFKSRLEVINANYSRFQVVTLSMYVTSAVLYNAGSLNYSNNKYQLSQLHFLEGIQHFFSFTFPSSKQAANKFMCFI